MARLAGRNNVQLNNNNNNIACITSCTQITVKTMNQSVPAVCGEHDWTAKGPKRVGKKMSF